MKLKKKHKEDRSSVKPDTNKKKRIKGGDGGKVKLTGPLQSIAELYPQRSKALKALSIHLTSVAKHIVTIVYVPGADTGINFKKAKRMPWVRTFDTDTFDSRASIIAVSNGIFSEQQYFDRLIFSLNSKYEEESRGGVN